MAAKIVQFPHKAPPIEPLAQFIRLAEQVKNLVPSAEVARQNEVDLEKLMTRMSKHSEAMKRQSNSFATLKESLKDSGTRARPVQRFSPNEDRSRGEQP